MKRVILSLLSILLITLAFIFAAVTGTLGTVVAYTNELVDTASVSPDQHDQLVTDSGNNANAHFLFDIEDIPVPTTSFTKIVETNGIILDYSNVNLGYVTVSNNSNSKVKFKIIYPDGSEYLYNARNTVEFETYTLSHGSGTYCLSIWVQRENNLHRLVAEVEIEVFMNNELYPFLLPNKYSMFNQNNEAIQKARELTNNSVDYFDMADKIYKFIATNIEYDEYLAETMELGYIPDIDRTLLTGKGICFDYASLMVSMLRSVGIPSRMVLGYLEVTGPNIEISVYHAWVEMYSISTGSWIHYDPTPTNSPIDGGISLNSSVIINTGNHSLQYRPMSYH